MSTDHDDLRSRLEELGGHVNAIRLPGPAAARRRGRQRTRRQATTAVLGAVAVAAAGVLAVGQPGLWTEPKYADEPTGFVPSPPDATPTPEPTEQPPATPFPESVLLTADDLEQQFAEPVGWAVADPPDEPFICILEPDPAIPTLRRTHEVADGRIDQVVEQYSDADAAQARFEDVSAEVLDCAMALREDSVDSGGPPEAWSLTEVGDDAALVRYWTPVTDGEWRELVAFSVVRAGTALTTIAWGGPAMDANMPMSPDLAVAAAERLCEPGGGACVGDPERRQTFPEPPGDSAGWLRAADIEEVIGLRLAPSGVDEPEDTPYFPCIPLHAMDVDTTGLERQRHFDPDDPTSGVTVTQHVVTFPDEAQAEDYFGTVQPSSVRHEECDQLEEATFSGDGFEGSVWKSRLGDTGPVASYGVVIRDRVVTTVEHGLESWNDREVTPRQWQDLVARAGERLADLR